MVKIKSSEITPEHIYLSRRKFMKGLGVIALSSAALAACGAPAQQSQSNGLPTSTFTPDRFMADPTADPNAPPDTPTSLDDITHYNNYYEFSPG